MQLRTVRVVSFLAAALALGAAQVGLAQVDWSFVKMEIPPGPPGSWDSYRHQVGDVVFDGTTYHMFLLGGQTFFVWDSPWHVGHWTWNALTQNWDPDPANPVLSPEPGQWDGWTVYDVAVLYEGGVFKMWYGATASFPGLIWAGYAESLDGSVWEKYEFNPLTGLEPGAPGDWYFGELLRNHEEVMLLGSTYLLIACLVYIHLFTKPVAVLALSILIVGDTMAAIVGKSIGRVRIFGKTREGSLACFTVCYGLTAFMPGIPFPVGLVGAPSAKTARSGTCSGFRNEGPGGGEGREKPVVASRFGVFGRLGSRENQPSR